MKRMMNLDRRSFLGSTATALVLSPLAALAATEVPAMAERPEGPDVSEGNPRSFGENIKQVDAGELNVGYIDEGPSDGPVVIMLHGWPYDINSFAEVVPHLTKKGYRSIVPYLRGYGTTKFLSDSTLRNGEQAAFAADIIALMDVLKINKALIAGFDWGARTACIIAALWPDRCKALVSVSGYLVGSQESGRKPLPPSAEFQWWYQFYFATERGKEGYDKNRAAFAKLIWQLASPGWKFSDATFDITAASLNNPDHVAIVIDNYRWRLGLSDGDVKYKDIESKLAAGPSISVPTITIEGDANGAPHPPASSYAAKYTGPYLHKEFKNTGHNPPQESPGQFAEVIVEADNLH
ncbi:MAG: alpha/beta hydrolase [Chitinophagaceae bacterium]